jgi:hypothetical protein
MVFLAKMIMAPTDTSGMSLAVLHFCRRPNDKRFKIKSLFNTKDMIDAFADCPQLVKLLKDNPSTGYDEAVMYYTDKSKCK